MIESVSSAAITEKEVNKARARVVSFILLKRGVFVNENDFTYQLVKMQFSLDLDFLANSTYLLVSRKKRQIMVI